MATVPEDLKYSKTHEWIRIDGDMATIGITDHAQDELGDITYLDLPEIGQELKIDQQFGEIESVKAVSELYAPLSGTVVSVNSEIVSTSEVVNEQPYEGGWLIKIQITNSSELAELLTAEDYLKLTEEGNH